VVTRGSVVELFTNGIEHETTGLGGIIPSPEEGCVKLLLPPEENKTPKNEVIGKKETSVGPVLEGSKGAATDS